MRQAGPGSSASSSSSGSRRSSSSDKKEGERCSGVGKRAGKVNTDNSRNARKANIEYNGHDPNSPLDGPVTRRLMLGNGKAAYGRRRMADAANKEAYEECSRHFCSGDGGHSGGRSRH